MWLTSLSRSDRDAVLALASRASESDGVAPLNEEAQLALGKPQAAHPLHRVERAGTDVVGYLQWQPGPGTGQVVVHPGHRRHGIGSRLAAALASEVASPRLWAFGDLSPARGFARALGLAPARTLLQLEHGPMAAAAAAPPLGLPAGMRLRRFRPEDADALLAVNAAAFADHPEQGALDAAGLSLRMAEPWFDADDLILAEDDAGLAGFHWTKRHDASTGEVYVLALAPRAQGRGLGPALLRVGLAHLAARGCRRALLYVDSAEQRTVRMYAEAGFRVIARDVLYASGPKELP